MTRINIAYLVSTLGRSGPTNQLYNLIHHLNNIDFDVSLITLSSEPSSSRWIDFSALDINLYSLKLNRASWILLGQQKLERLLSKIKPSIIHSQGLRADWHNSKLDSHYSRVSTQRNDPFVDYRMLYGRLSGSLLANLHVKSLKLIPNVFTCSRTLSETNLKYNLCTNYIRNGIEYDPINSAPSLNEKITQRELLDLPTDSKLFVWVGPFIDRKSPQTTIRAFLNIKNTHNYYVCLLGNGPLYKECRTLAGHSNKIIFRGNVANVPDYLQSADGFISSSVSEGMPNSVLESLAYSTPVILSDIPAHQEILALSKYAGRTYKTGDVQQLIEAIETLDTSELAASAARKLIETSLNAQVMSKSYQDFYQTLVV